MDDERRCGQRHAERFDGFVDAVPVELLAVDLSLEALEPLELPALVPPDSDLVSEVLVPADLSEALESDDFGSEDLESEALESEDSEPALTSLPERPAASRLSLR